MPSGPKLLFPGVSGIWYNMPVYGKRMELQMRKSLWFLALVASMGGFLFGYDTAVINGGEQQIQDIWHLSGFMHGLVMSSALWGTVIGAASGGRITDGLGRRLTLFWSGVFYLVSAVWSGVAFGPWDLMVARFIGGLAVGVSSIAAPVYIAEISPADRRGLMGGLFQLNIMIGMIASQFVNWYLGTANLGDATWRWMLGAESVPALAFTLLAPFLVESPKWLEMKSGTAARQDVAGSGERFFQRKHALLIFLAMSVAAFDQLSGINAVMYFAKRIFEMAGCASNVAYGVAAFLSVISGIGTLLGLYFIDRIGRRKLILIGCTGCVVAHFATAASFLLNTGVVASAFVFVFVVFYQLGQGVVMWVFLSELFPTRFRAQGQSIGVFTHWMFAAVLTFVFPMMAVGWAPWMIFAFFGVCLTLMIFWALFLMPETKGRELE